MPLTDTQQSAGLRSNAAGPRIGIPWRTTEEEDNASKGEIGKTQDYIKAVEDAGGQAILVPLRSDKEQERSLLIPTLDAFVLPGSPRDVDPTEYKAEDNGLSEKADKNRESTDRSVLEFAFAQRKPVLAICYGFQMLNVYKGGTLIQDIQTELKNKTKKLQRHRKQDPPRSEKDPEHDAIFAAGSRLARLAGGTAARVNSSHHQAVDRPGNDLKITARATDDIIEGVEWTGDSNWVIGVQWHPERMQHDPFAQRLFQEFVAAALAARESVVHKT